jgi:hypothetical protein
MSKKSKDSLAEIDAEMRAEFAEILSKEKDKQKRKRLEKTANFIIKCIEDNKPLNFRAEVAIEIVFDGRLSHIKILEGDESTEYRLINSDIISFKTRDSQTTSTWAKIKT